MTPEFMVERVAPQVDEPISLRLTGIEPGRCVRLDASCIDRRGVGYASWAEYEAGPVAVVDPARQAPRAGTYEGVDPFGLWWSMTSAPKRPFARGLTPIPTTISAAIEGEVVARVEFQRLRVGPGVTVEPVRKDGFVATLFTPGSRPAPAVIVLGGSEGGLSLAEEQAALLSAHGHTVLALAYFGVEGLPPQLAEIPLEYLDNALSWLLERSEVVGESVAAVGTSRGGELALLFASQCARVHAVVGFAASGVLWPGFTPGASAPRPAWLRDGKALPYAVPIPGRSARLDAAEPLELDAFFRRGLEHTERVARAEIPVERIRGPLLLVSGGGDKMWPSYRLAESALRRRAAVDLPFRDQHLTYPEAGHAVGHILGLPAALISTVDAQSGMRFVLGGTKAANARAAQDAWPKVIAFLSEHRAPGSHMIGGHQRRGAP